MKRFLYILAAVALSSVATAQPVFRSVSWGMSRDEVSAIEGRDARGSFVDTTFGVALARYRFDGDDMLVGVDLDLVPLSSGANASVANAAAALSAMPTTDSLLSLRFGPASDGGIIRSNCAETTAERVAAGCERVAFVYALGGTAVEHFVDRVEIPGVGGDIAHMIVLRPAGPASTPAVAAPAAMDLR